MANPTTNYGWPMPTSTDLVTDLPADFAAFGQPVDTSLKALNPETTLGDIAYRSATANTNTRLGIGTTGQVLAVSGAGVPAWTTTADVTPLTTKGDLFTFTTVDARLGVGANNTVLTADSAEASGLKWATVSAGGLTVLASGSLSSTAVNLTSISQSYVNLYLVIRDLNITSAGQVLNMRFNNDSSGIYQISNSSSNGYQTNATDTSMLVGIGNLSTSNGDASFAININDYTSASWKIGTAISFTLDNAGGYGLGDQRFGMRSTTAISEINLFMTSGNFSGSYILYGVK